MGFKPGSILTVAVIIVFIAALSPAEEITLTTYMRNQLDTYVIGDINAPLTVIASSGGLTTIVPIDPNPISWTAPRSGTILVTWYHPGVYVSALAGTPSGSLGFSMNLNGTQGAFGTLRFMENIARYNDREIYYPPIVDSFTVTRETEYEINLQYEAVSFANLAVELMSDPGRRSIIEIKYIDTP